MTTESPVEMPARRRRWLLLGVLALAFSVRFAHWMAVRGEPFVAQLVVDSKEYDAWAQQIAAGDWLGSRVFFQAPLYPYLLAGTYAVIGRSLDAAYLLQIVAAVAGVWALFHAGRLMGGDPVGLVAAALAAVYGPFLFYDVQILKESLAVTSACFLLWAVARARTLPGSGPWLASGVLLGILALLRENALLMTPFLVALAYRRGAAPRAVMLRCAALVVGVVLPLVPVAVRNGAVGGDYLPTTSQGGVNFYIGNNATADGTYRPVVPGKQIPSLERQESTRVAETAMGRTLTPAEVSSYWLRAALGWARSHPWDFVRLQFRKLGMYWSWYEWPDSVDYYWLGARSPVFRMPLVEFSTISLLSIAGLAVLWRRRLFDAFAPAWVFASVWMLSTILFFLFSRYRLPGIPALIILGAVPVVAIVELRRAGDRRWRLGATLAAATFLLSLAPFGKPRIDLVEFNLGRLAQERGDTAEAEAHYEAALAEEPKSLLACLNLGTIAAGRQDWPAALAFYRQAEAIEPRSDDVQCDLGGVLLAMGDGDQAGVHLDRALALNPQNLMALQNKTVLLRRRGDFSGAKELNRRLLELDPQSPPGLRMKDRLAAAQRPAGG
jgi:4-amino-4-deoxy-L-arabinose transferase-like glycosyltransferase